MESNQINIKFKNIRAIRDANVILNGITVIAGENGCGKSTISKLTYHLFHTSIEFDKIVDKKLSEELKRIYKTLDQLTRELSYFLNKEEYLNIRNSFRKFLSRNELQLNLFEEGNGIATTIDYLIKLFSGFDENLNVNPELIKGRLDRIKIILRDLFDSKENKKETISELLENLKKLIDKNILKSENLKETRPVSILDEKINEAFYDLTIPTTYNVHEYGVPVIDRTNKKLLPIHSIQKVTYIDTPMIFGIDFYAERSHWNEINELISQKERFKTDFRFDSIFKDEILQGEANIEDNEISSRTFKYKRVDGQEFDLLECATGLKSFSILQLLYKNGFLTNKTLLIIDEPEVHLHPQWVVEYARLIVLLNKYVGVKFLIASHHPDMISAIKYISEKEKNSHGLNFYLAKQVQDKFHYNYSHLGTEIEEIFSSFNIALERIDLYGETE